MAPPSAQTRSAEVFSSLRSVAAILSGTKSPLSKTRRSRRRAKRSRASAISFTYSSSIVITGGAVFHTVTPHVSIRSNQCFGFFSCFASGITRVPPAAITPNIS